VPGAIDRPEVIHETSEVEPSDRIVPFLEDQQNLPASTHNTSLSTATLKRKSRAGRLLKALGPPAQF
jgi:hypothetical protein